MNKYSVVGVTFKPEEDSIVTVLSKKFKKESILMRAHILKKAIRQLQIEYDTVLHEHDNHTYELRKQK